jgi:hypothetical protein
METTPPTDRFRFHLRTLFIVMTVLAIPLAWVGHALTGGRLTTLNMPFAVASFACIIGVLNWVSTRELWAGVVAGLFTFSVLLWLFC